MKSEELRAALTGRVDEVTFRQMMDGLFAVPHVAMWVKDQDLRYIFVTPAWERSAGLRQESVIGRRDEDFRPQEIAERFAEVDQRILDTGIAETREERLRTDFGVRAFTTTKFPLRDRDGVIFAVAGISTETTDQRMMPASSRTDARLLAVVLESMPDAIVRFDADFRITFANPSFTTTYGRKSADPVGETLGDLFGPRLLSQFRDAVYLLSDSQPETILEDEWTAYDGRPRWRTWRFAAVFTDGGALTEVQAIGSDVTDQKAYRSALEALLATSSRPDAPLGLILDEVLGVGLQYFNLEIGAVVHLGGEVAQIERVVARRGPPPPHRVLLDILASLPLSMGATVAEPDARATTSVDPRVGAYVMQPLETNGQAAGAVVLYAPAARAQPFPPQGAMLLRLIGQWLAMAMERDRRVAQVSRSRSELSLILENVPAEVTTVGPGGRVYTANAAARASHRPLESRDADEESIASGTRSLATERWERETGAPRWMRTERIPFVDGPSGEPRLLVVAIDLTDLVEHERALAKANEGLAQFAYIASHDLQEPLRKIGTFVDIMLEGLATGNEEDITYSTRVIKDSARRASALIKDLLTWSRVSNQGLNRKPLRFASVVREIVQDVIAARPDETIEVVDAMADIVVPADGTQVRQLVENLFVNAIKYRHPDRPARIVLGLGRGGRRSAVFDVSDNGIGFEPVYAQQIFEPFRRLHSEREYSGTGVGLAICARVCENHGWLISADGRPGEGATFSVTMGLGPDGTES